MKNLSLSIILISILMGLSSCKEDCLQNNDQGQQENDPVNGIVLNTNKQWTTSKLPTYIGDISFLPQELQTVIHQRFPEKSNMDDACVILVGAKELADNSELLNAAAKDGAFVTVFGDTDYSLLGEAPLVSPDNTNDLPTLLYCYSGWGAGQHYIMYDEPEFFSAEEGEPSMTVGEWEEMMANNSGLKEENFVIVSDYDNELSFNENYFHTRMDPFVEWVDDKFMDRYIDTRASSMSYDNIKVNVEESGQLLVCNYPFHISAWVDRTQAPLVKNTSFWLEKDASVSVEFMVYPIYMLSSNKEKSGDYYGVVSTITPHNQSLWGPYVANWYKSQIRIYGLWFNEMDVITRLTDINDDPIPGLRYFERPIPENKNDSKNYSEGKSIYLSGTLSAGVSGKDPAVNAQLGVGVTWGSSTNYTLETINYMLNSSTPEVRYHYWTENVNLNDDWDKMNQYFPAPVRSEFSARTMWVWHVPGNVVKDNDTAIFKLHTNVMLSYCAWHHWRGTAQFDSNKKTYYTEMFSKSWKLRRPDRTPWGFIRLRNASDKEMAHLRFYDVDKEGGEPVAQLTTSFGKGEEAKIALSEGTYNITWDFVDGNTGAKLSSWIYKNVKVRQGRDEASATVSISSIDGEKVQ